MGLPAKQGLYDPRNEHDACGVGFVANIKGRKSHDDHRARGCRSWSTSTIAARWAPTRWWATAPAPDPDAGRAAARLGARSTDVDLPPPGRLRRGDVLPAAGRAGARLRHQPVRALHARSKASACSAGATCRSTPTGLGKAVIETMPVIRQAIIGRGPHIARPGRLRAQAADHPQADAEPAAPSWPMKHELPGLTELYMPSFSTRTVVYKGLLLAHAGRQLLRRPARTR